VSLRRVERVLVTAMIVTAAALVVFLAAWFATAEAHGTGCHSRGCDVRVAMKQCSQSRVVPCIRRAALHHRVSMPMLLRKARCESTLNPLAVNGVHAGLFQFRIAAPSTWATTPYAARSPWRAKWNALAAAWMHRADVGRGNEWACR
jgi:hypothetical protein